MTPVALPPTEKNTIAAKTPTSVIQPPPLHKAQLEVLSHPARFKVVAAGRRWGKGFLCSWISVREAMNGGRVWWIAPTFRISLIGWRIIKRLINQLPGIRIIESQFRAEFPGGGWIEIKSADSPNSLRGEGLTLAILDEAAFINEDAWKAAVRPALSDFQGKAYFISTPNGRNWFWRLWTLGKADETGEWHSFTYPTASNPFIAPEEIVSAKNELPSDIFRQEYEAFFVQEGGLVFRNLTPVLYTPPYPHTKPAVNTTHVAGVDWAQLNDYTVVSVIDIDTGAVVHVERFNQIGWSVQLDRVQRVFQDWNVESGLIEENSIGGPMLESLFEEGLPVSGFQTTNTSKARIIRQLAAAIEHKRILIPNHEWLVEELEAFEAGRSPSGKWTYNAPVGLHDDGVISLALAYESLKNYGDVVMYTAKKKW